MSHVTYKVVEHDGGWAYKVGDVFSETFPTHDAAQAAAARRKSNVLQGRAARSSTRTARANGMKNRKAATIGRAPTSKTRFRTKNYPVLRTVGLREAR
jgi:Uncharacterized protein conserved in bacteria (DUF2188)